MTAHARRATSVPRSVTLFSPILQALLRAGVKLGPNALVTIRGRTSGLPRTTPLAIVQTGGRRWIWAPWGDAHWVANLRAAGRATLRVHDRDEEVTAVELNHAERIAFFREVLGPYAAARRGGLAFVRYVDGVDLRDPVAAAEGRAVFELNAAQNQT